MASTSSSSSFKKTYHVFLSFRGEDTRRTFVDHLYKALDTEGIYTYKDDITLPRGKDINPALMKAIQESRIVVVVFSKNYADSSWCLDELVKIMECRKERGQIVFPVFYHVDPSEVRKQKGLFGEAFSKHEKDKKVEVWKEALVDAANLSGWEPKSIANGHEAKCIEQIVETISLELRHTISSVDEHLIGIDPRLRKVEALLEIESNDVRMIGIWGMGGAGKTTVARAIFDKLSHHFKDGKCFVDSVRGVSQLQLVQEKILVNVLKKQSMRIDNVPDGKRLIKERLSSKKVLIVLDDVDHLSQLEALAGADDWFDGGSRIIITTRDQQVLEAHGVKKILTDTVDLLEEKEATQLFSRYAFGANIPTNRYKDLSVGVVKYAAGLPLTLKVLGSFLRGRELNEWTSALQKLKDIPENETVERLKISFKGLDDDQKKIFLDIACFFRGWEKDVVFRILSSCGYFRDIDLSVLKQKSLLTVSNERFQMHDLIQEMGRDIVCQMHANEPEKYSRLWRPKDVLDVLTTTKGSANIKSIVLGNFHTLEAVDITESFTNMEKLMLLYFHNSKGMTFQGPKHLPNELRWLTWDFYYSESLPESFRGNKLVGLEMRDSSIVKLWKGTEGFMSIFAHFGTGREIRVLDNLKFLDLTGSTKLIRTPDFTEIPNLERLTLEQCSSLAEVHRSIGGLKKLVYLNLAYCIKLRSFPPIVELKSLETLDLSGCLQLKELPESLGSLNSLLRLHLSHNVIVKLPTSIGDLQKLAHLDLTGCLKLKVLPESLGNLGSLLELHLTHNVMEELPSSIGNLAKLAHLDLTFSRNLKTLPGTICSLKCLRILILHGCLSLWELPENLDQLEDLEKLDVSRTSIRRLPETISRLKCLEFS